LLWLFDAGKTMPDWSGCHVKTDGRAYFRFYILEDLKDVIGPFPMVNLRMKASREAERLALMHFIALQGVIEDARQKIKSEALKPRPVPLSDFSEESIRDFAVRVAQACNREQYAAIRGMEPLHHLLNIHNLLAKIAGDVLSATDTRPLAGLAAIFLHKAGTPFDHNSSSFKTLVFELATALDTEYIKPSTRRLQGREAVTQPPLPVGQHAFEHTVFENYVVVDRCDGV
jgi:hypothetical protein